jgi:hypothetical protein
MATGQDPAGQTPFGQAVLFYGESEFVTFITVAPLMQAENPGLTVVRYGLAEDEYGDPYWGVMETAYTGFESFTEMVGAPSGKPLALVEGIEFLEFQYYGFDAQFQSFDWYDYWSGDEMSAVPRAVKVIYNDKSIIVPVNATTLGNNLQAGVRGLVGTGRQ